MTHKAQDKTKLVLCVLKLFEPTKNYPFIMDSQTLKVEGHYLQSVKSKQLIE